MRTAEEIEAQFKGLLKKATNGFIGSKITEDTVDELQAAVTAAALAFYNGLTPLEIDTYNINVPRPRVYVNGNEISVESY